MKKLLFFTGILFVVAACSKNKDADNTTVSAGNTISITSSGFSPASLQVNINATVTWVNNDNIVHTVTANDGSFDSGDIPPGSRYSHSFTSTGTYNYHCLYHTAMTGTIVVAGVR